MATERVNWTIQTETMKTLKVAKKLTGKSFSHLIKIAVENTFVDQIEMKRKKVKELFAEAYKLKTELEELEELRRCENK